MNKNIDSLYFRWELNIVRIVVRRIVKDDILDGVV